MVDYKVSTQTLVGYGTGPIDIGLFFNTLTGTPLIGEPTGFLSIEYLQKLHCTPDASKVRTNPSTKFFGNALTLSIFVVDKKINCKLSKNGRIQMTGVKTRQQALEATRRVVAIIKSFPNAAEICPAIGQYKFYIIPVMINVGFAIGFVIDKTRLAAFIAHSEHSARVSTSFAYTAGLKVITHLPAESFDYTVPLYDSATDTFENISFQKFLKLPGINPSPKIIRKVRKATFIVFNSGSVIMSGCNFEHVDREFAFFVNLIQQNRDAVEEKLLVDQR